MPLPMSFDPELIAKAYPDALSAAGTSSVSSAFLRIDERTSSTIHFTRRLLRIMQVPFSADTGQFGPRPALTTLSAVLAGARTTCTQYTTLRTIVVSVTCNIQLGQLSIS